VTPISVEVLVNIKIIPGLHMCLHGMDRDSFTLPFSTIQVFFGTEQSFALGVFRLFYFMLHIECIQVLNFNRFVELHFVLCLRNFTRTSISDIISYKEL
jgi:hypothetical protein